MSSDFGSDALSRTHYSMQAFRPVHPVPVTPVKAHAGGIVGLIQDAKGTTDKNLPTAAFIPPQFMALAAVLTSLAVVFIQFLLVHIGSLAQLGAKVAKFFADLPGGHAIEKISDKEIEAREIKAERRERPFFGLSAVEILVLEAAVIMVAVAFLLADRDP